jgi:hypothetical protein
MSTISFTHTIDYWLKQLDHYNFTQLCIRPSPNSWSLGQVYKHILSESDFFLEQAEICLYCNDNFNEKMSATAKSMLRNNEFPDELIEGPPSNIDTPQPSCKEELFRDLLNLKSNIIRMGELISESPFKGKTKHPGLQYFNAQEWLQFAEMHCRHHLRQKQRIDDFLESSDIR